MEKKFTDYMKYLFAAALKKSGSIQEAEDLTQEVFLAALVYERRGGVIGNPKAWLASTLNHKFYDSLRRRYALPTVSIDELPDDIGEPEQAEEITDEELKREVAYLARLQRDVIVMHYLEGRKIQTIAEELGVPRGTVLSRLASGRKQIRKGLDEMESYEKQSYSPETLYISCYGREGFRGEPWSAVAEDMLKQNILITAYEHPATVTGIARALGIPAPYVEAAVDALLKADLMSRSGNKVFTDFMIVTPDDMLKGLEEEIAYADAHYGEILAFVREYTGLLKETGLCPDMPENKWEKLTYFFVIHLLSKALYTASRRIVPSTEEYPSRPDGGAWIAEGARYPRGFDFGHYRFLKYTYGGMRGTFWESAFGAHSIDLKVYDTQPDLNRYQNGPVEINDDDLAKMLYIISRGIPFESTGFNLMYLKDIPHLTACGVLAGGGGRVRVDIPELRPEEYDTLNRICTEQMTKLADLLEPGLREIFPKLKIGIPKHLEGRVAEFRRYPCHAIPMAFIRRASAKADLGFVRAKPPMVFVVDDGGDVIG